MYEKKINIFNNDDRFIMNKTFKYNVILMVCLLIILGVLLLFKRNQYYENKITFLDSKSAVLMVNKDYLNSIKDSKELFLDEISYKYNIEKVEEINNIYFVYVNFNMELKINEEYYKIFIRKEKLIEYFIRIIKDLK